MKEQGQKPHPLRRFFVSWPVGLDTGTLGGLVEWAEAQFPIDDEDIEVLSGVVKDMNDTTWSGRAISSIEDDHGKERDTEFSHPSIRFAATIAPTNHCVNPHRDIATARRRHQQPIPRHRLTRQAPTDGTQLPATAFERPENSSSACSVCALTCWMGLTPARNPPKLPHAGRTS
jgi:hypothetical protein